MLFSRQELWHPALVHFPIAIAFIWVLLELVTLFYKQIFKNMDVVFVFLATLGALTAFLSNFTGEMAESVLAISPLRQQQIAHHADIALYIFWLYLLLVVVTAIKCFVPNSKLRLLRFTIAIATTIIVCIAAYRGSELVYKHHLGIQEKAPANTSRPID